MANWFNSDGLLVKLGITEAVSNPGGEYEFDGNIHWTEVDIVGTSLTSSYAILSDNVLLPKGARIHSISLYVETAFTSGGAATLGVALINGSDRSTAVFTGSTGVINDTALSTINAVGVASPTQGSAVGSTIATTPGVLVAAKYGTAAFTAGKAKLRINWYIP